MRAKGLLFVALLLVLAGCAPQQPLIIGETINDTVTLTPRSSAPLNASEGMLYVKNDTVQYRLCLFNGNNWSEVGTGATC